MDLASAKHFRRTKRNVVTGKKTYTGGGEQAEPARRPMDRERALALYKKALAEFDEVLTARAARILAGEETTPEQAVRDDAARQNLENARALLRSLPLA